MPVIGAYGCCLLIGLAGISTERMFGRNYNSLRIRPRNILYVLPNPRVSKTHFILYALANFQ